MNTVTLDNSFITTTVISGASFSYTVGSQLGMRLVVVIMQQNAATGHGTVTAGGVSMNRIQSGQSNGNVIMDAFELYNPPTGAITIAVSVVAGSNGAWVGMASYYNNAPSLDGSAINVTTNASPASSALATVAANVVTFAVGWGEEASSTPSGYATNASNLLNKNIGGTAGSTYIGDSGVNATPGTTVTQSISGSAAVPHQVVQIAMAPNNSIISAPTLSIMSGAGRSVALARAVVLIRANALTMMNAAGLTTTVVRNWPRSVSLTMLNAASRFITIFSRGGIWIDVSKHTSTPTNATKHTNSWTNNIKDSSTFSNRPKT